MLIETYFSIGKVIGLIVGVLIFIAAYIYYISAYGTRFGLGLGWLPSGLLAVSVGWFAMVVWAPVLVIVTVIVFFARYAHHK
jgi:hypothetical protein